MEEAEAGTIFMQEMMRISQKMDTEVHASPPRVVQLISSPFIGWPVFVASPAQFGKDPSKTVKGLMAPCVKAVPFRACSSLQNMNEVRGRIVVVERSQCMFIEKAKFVQDAGGLGVIVIDHLEGTSAMVTPQFAMSGDGTTVVNIPAVFLFRKQGVQLIQYLNGHPELIIRIGRDAINPAYLWKSFFANPGLYRTKSESLSTVRERNDVVVEESTEKCVTVNSITICESVKASGSDHVTKYTVSSGLDAAISLDSLTLSELLDPQPIRDEKQKPETNEESYSVSCETDLQGDILCKRIEKLAPPGGQKPKLTPPPSCPKTKFPAVQRNQRRLYVDEENKLKEMKKSLGGIMNVVSCVTDGEFEMCKSVEDNGNDVNVLTYRSEQLFLSPFLSPTEVARAKQTLINLDKLKSIDDMTQEIVTISQDAKGGKGVAFHFHDNRVTHNVPQYNKGEIERLERKLYNKLVQQTNFGSLSNLEGNIQVISKLIRNSLGLTLQLSAEDNAVLVQLTEKLELRWKENDDLQTFKENINTAESVMKHSKDSDKVCKFNPKSQQIECIENNFDKNKNGG